MEQSRGTYVLLIELSGEETITIGRRQNVHFPHGYYAYVGSAMGGIKSRLKHHLKRDKKLHWHIDYLLQKASIVDIDFCEIEDKIECVIADVLGAQFDCIPGFGSSDCHCRSHLFFAPEEGKLKAAVKLALESLVSLTVERN